MTGHTFTGHTACCAAGVAVQKIVAREKARRARSPARSAVRKMIAEATQGIEAVGDIRGRGFFIGIELVKDRETKTPFDSGAQALPAHPPASP